MHQVQSQLTLSIPFQLVAMSRKRLYILQRLTSFELGKSLPKLLGHSSAPAPAHALIRRTRFPKPCIIKFYIHHRLLSRNLYLKCKCFSLFENLTLTHRDIASVILTSDGIKVAAFSEPMLRVETTDYPKIRQSAQTRIARSIIFTTQPVRFFVRLCGLYSPTVRACLTFPTQTIRYA